MADLIALGQQLPQQYHVAHIEMAIHDARRKHCMSMRAGLIVSVFMRSCPIFVQCHDISIFGGNTTPSDRLMQQADFVVFMQFYQNLHARLSPPKLINYIYSGHKKDSRYVPQGYACLAGDRNDAPLLPA